MTSIFLVMALLSGFLLPAGYRLQDAVTMRSLIEAEYARSDSAGVLARAIAGPDSLLRQRAIRALGRLEDPKYAPPVISQLSAIDAGSRREAVNAIGQMKAGHDLIALLRSERDPGVRSAIYETIGRTPAAASGAAGPPAGGAPPVEAGDGASIERVLLQGLREPSEAREGAARGIEAYLRSTIRRRRPQAATLEALRSVFLEERTVAVRRLLLAALNTAGDRDSAVVASALADIDVETRRLGVLASRQWLEDSSAIVRIQGVAFTEGCSKLEELFSDPSEHVALAALDLAGERRCSRALLVEAVDGGRSWRIQSHALVALARVSPSSAKERLPRFTSHPVWQARVYGAKAARILGDSAVLEQFSRDGEPNVVAAAINSVSDAKRALRTTHAGLALEAIRYIQQSDAVADALEELLDLLHRTTEGGNVTLRDVRVAVLRAIAPEGGSGKSDLSDTANVEAEKRGARSASVRAAAASLLSDVDPVVAAQAARILTATDTGTWAPRTLRYIPPALSSTAWDGTLRETDAVIRFHDLGDVTIALLYDEAPVTVATFVGLAESGRFDGLTIHRVVPNFVVQGGSPGADEYDGLSSHFMRDELGFARHERGTLGISTRGRDTGDGQIFINLVDNPRLNHDYTVFARITEGMSIVDLIGEGTVIESIRIKQRSSGKR